LAAFKVPKVLQGKGVEDQIEITTQKHMADSFETVVKMASGGAKAQRHYINRYDVGFEKASESQHWHANHFKNRDKND
jgi:hypothetical protein